MSRSLRATATPPTPARTTGGPVQAIRPDPLVWAAAMALVDGDARRLRVDQRGNVHVLNHPR